MSPDFARSEDIKLLAVIACTLLATGCQVPSHPAAPANSAPATSQVSSSAPTVTQRSGQPLTSAATRKVVIDGYGRAWSVIDRDGTYLVGVDIWPGRYQNFGGANCHLARLGSLDPSDVLESKASDNPQFITIRANDTAFSTRNCGMWQMIPAI